MADGSGQHAGLFLIVFGLAIAGVATFLIAAARSRPGDDGFARSVGRSWRLLRWGGLACAAAGLLLELVALI